MEEAERFDPSGLERIELAVAQLTSAVTGILGKGLAPADVAADWGGLRAKAKVERLDADLLAGAKRRAQERAGRKTV